MAVSNSNAQAVLTTGSTLTTVTATVTDGNAFALPSGAAVMLVEVSNGSGGAISVVVDDPNSVAPAGATAFNADLTVACPTGLTQFKVTDLQRFKDDTTDRIKLTASAVTSVTMKVSYV